MDPKLTRSGEPVSPWSHRLQDLSFSWTDRDSLMDDRTEPFPEALKEEYKLYIRSFREIFSDFDDLKSVYDSTKGIVLRTEDQSLPRIRLLSATAIALGEVVWARSLEKMAGEFLEGAERDHLERFDEKFKVVHERGQELVRSSTMTRASKAKILEQVRDDLSRDSGAIVSALHLKAAQEMRRFNVRAGEALDELLRLEPDLSEPWKDKYEEYLQGIGHRLHDQTLLQAVKRCESHLQAHLTEYRKLKA